MSKVEKYPFLAVQGGFLLPILPLSLHSNPKVITGHALLDTGSTVNVLPYEMGIALGISWEAQTIPVQLTGNLANLEAKALLLSASVGNFEPVQLAFAWTKASNAPFLLGQVNFFMEFDICLYRAKSEFEVKRKT